MNRQDTLSSLKLIVGELDIREMEPNGDVSIWIIIPDYTEEGNLASPAGINRVLRIVTIDGHEYLQLLDNVSAIDSVALEDIADTDQLNTLISSWVESSQRAEENNRAKVPAAERTTDGKFFVVHQPPEEDKTAKAIESLVGTKAFFLVEYSGNKIIDSEGHPHESIQDAIDLGRAQHWTENSNHENYWVAVYEGEMTEEGWHWAEDKPIWLMTVAGRAMFYCPPMLRFLQRMGVSSNVYGPEQFVIGNQLRNGAISIGSWKGFTYGVVLAMRPGSPEPYVTWEFRLDQLATYSGHYFDNIIDATRDFGDRIAKVIGKPEEYSSSQDSRKEKATQRHTARLLGSQT